MHEPWSVQACYPMDRFMTCTLTVEQWLSNSDEEEDLAQKWRLLIHACFLMEPHIRRNDLQQAPRVCYDPGHDATFFIFKVADNGTTFLVAKSRVALPTGIEIEGWR